MFPASSGGGVEVEKIMEIIEAGVVLIGVFFLFLWMFASPEKGKDNIPYPYGMSEKDKYFFKKNFLSLKRRQEILENQVLSTNYNDSTERVLLFIKKENVFKVLVFNLGPVKFTYETLPVEEHYVSHGIWVTYDKVSAGYEPGPFAEEVMEPSYFTAGERSLISKFRDEHNIV